jgi:hypothetical protein
LPLPIRTAPPVFGGNVVTRQAAITISPEPAGGKQLDNGIATLWYGFARLRVLVPELLPDTKVVTDTFAQ